MTLFERVCEHLSQQNYEPPVVSAIITLNGALKTFGPQAESLYKEQVDKLQVKARQIIDYDINNKACFQTLFNCCLFIENCKLRFIAEVNIAKIALANL
jgi:hypothetical protein